MAKNIFSGLGTAMITSFGEDGAVDYVALADLIDRQIGAGVNFLVPAGTTGEAPTLNYEEHVKLIAVVVRQAKNRVPVLAGTGSNSTAEAVKLTQAAKVCGADGVLVVSPYYNKPTQKGIKLHYREIAKIGLPIILYDIPGRCGGSGVSASTILELAYSGVICGLKWASGNHEQLQKVAEGRPENFVILSGDDNQTYYAMNQGADGVISVVSNLMPKKMVEFVTALRRDAESMRCTTLNDYLSEIMEAMFFEVNPIPVKTAMAMVWPQMYKETFRLPMCQMETENREKLVRVLRKYDLLK